jgi:hypothetical protein
MGNNRQRAFEEKTTAGEAEDDGILFRLPGDGPARSRAKKAGDAVTMPDCPD